MQGNIFVISAASGTGKTTLIARLLQHHSDIRVSVSHTTRAPRRGEENGKHYHFVSVPEFERMIEEGQFVEYAKVYGNYYGTSTQSLESLTRQGVDVILEIDTQGDYLVVNDDLAAAEAALLHIIKSQRFHLESQTPFLTELLGSGGNA